LCGKRKSALPLSFLYSFCLFIAVKRMNNLQKKKKEKAKATPQEMAVAGVSS
jgi:large-conductance mechanosensitive channel